MTSKFRSLVVFASFLAVAACGDDGTSPGQPQSHIEILPAETESLGLGDTLRLTARRVDANGLPLANDSLIHFLWQSSDTTVLVVDSYGLVEAMDFGTATISVRITDTVSIMFPHPTDTAVAAVQLTSRPDVVHPGPVAAMAVGHPFHACVLLVNGTVECRGRNNLGQIGIGTIGADVATWSLVSGGHTFSTISTSYFHSCGMGTDGRGYCWGTNNWRNLDMDLDVREMPVPAEFGEDYRWMAIHGGGDGRTCGITTGQVPMCAGRNGWGQTGHDGEWQQPLREWGSGHLATAIKTNLYRTCAVVADGALYCSGQDFLGSSRDGYVPFLVDGSGVVLETFDIGDRHGCGLSANGKAYCWGRNHQGQLGTGDLTDSESMRPVVGGHVFTSIHTGGSLTSCGLTAAGEVWCWGAIGRTRPDSSSIPVRVPLAPGVKALSLTVSGGRCIVDASRRMSCWNVGDTRWGGASALAQDGGRAPTALPSTPPPPPSTPPSD